MSSDHVDRTSQHTLLVLGSPQCGKSSFITRLVKDKFSEKVASTPAGSVEIQTEALIELQKKKEERLHIIEASGEREAFRANYKRWFVQSGAVLVLYDASSAVSFDFACKLVANLLFDREAAKPRLPFAFIGTQSDRAAAPAVSVAVAAQFAERHGACVHGHVSAKGDKRTALLALVRVLLEQLRPDRVNASMRVVTKKSELVADTLAKIGDSSTDEFTAALLAIRATLRHRVDADKLIRDEHSFNMLCSALGKLEALLDVYASKLDKSARSGKLQRFVSNNKLRRKLEKLSSQLEAVRTVVETTIASVLVADDAPAAAAAGAASAASGTSGAPDTPAPPAPLQAPPDSASMRARSPDIRPPARPAPEPDVAQLTRSSKSSSSAALALASATTMTMARLATVVDLGSVMTDDQEARAFWSRAFGNTLQVPFEQFVHEFGALALADSGDMVIKPADARVLRAVLDDAETDFVNVYKFAHFARGFAPLRGCLERVVRLVSKPYFAGFVTSDDATRLLSHLPLGTFLVRFSKSRPGSFAIAYVDANAADRVSHARLQSARGGGFTMNKTAFESIEELVRVYQHQGVLTVGLADSIVREPWFRGDFDDAEATACLQFTPPGSFLVRFDPHKKGYTFVVSFVAADRTIQHVPVRADESGIFRAFSFGLASDGAARTVRDIVEANSTVLRHAAPRDDGNAEERALDPFAAFDDDTAKAGAAAASDDCDDIDAVLNSVYQPLPGVAKPSPLKGSPPTVPTRTSRSGSNSGAPPQQQQQYAFISPSADAAAAGAPQPLKRRSGAALEPEPTYQVPSMLNKAGSNPLLERRSAHAEPPDAVEYRALGEERFDKYLDEDARHLINERKHEVPVIRSPQNVPPPAAVRAAPLSPTPVRAGRVVRVVHDGNAVLGDNGDAVVTLPAAFVRDSRDFRYFLTPIGRFAALFVAQEVDPSNNTFRIAGGQVGTKVSWQVAAEK